MQAIKNNGSGVKFSLKACKYFKRRPLIMFLLAIDDEEMKKTREDMNTASGFACFLATLDFLFLASEKYLQCLLFCLT